MLGDSETVGDGNRLLAGKNRRARISLFLGIVPILVIAVKSKLRLTRLHLSFLQTEDICIKRIKAFIKILVKARSYSVDIP